MRDMFGSTFYTALKEILKKAEYSGGKVHGKSILSFKILDRTSVAGQENEFGKLVMFWTVFVIYEMWAWN